MSRKHKKTDPMVINIESITINLTMTETCIKPVDNLKEEVAGVILQALQEAKNQPSTVL